MYVGPRREEAAQAEVPEAAHPMAEAAAEVREEAAVAQVQEEAAQAAPAEPTPRPIRDRLPAARRR